MTSLSNSTNPGASKADPLHVLRDKLILIVDDNAAQLEALEFSLQGCGLMVEAVMHGKSEITELVEDICERVSRNRSTAHIVLLDYNLNWGVKGDELAKALQEANPALILIGFSAGGVCDLSGKTSDTAEVRFNRVGVPWVERGSSDATLAGIARLIQAKK